MKIAPYIKILRPVNLIILAATLYFLDLFILQPLFDRYGLLFTLDEFHFFLLVFSVVLICGAGYVINDYFDIKSDSVNKPQKQIIGKSISQAKAFQYYSILTLVGVALGVYVSIRAGNWKLVTFHIISIFLLYAYSASFQKIALLGNIIVALLSSLSILLVGVFEPHVYNLVREGDYYAADLCWYFIIGMSVFAFIMTMSREIVKDVEDIQGDKSGKLRTIPIVWGIQLAKILAIIFMAITGIWAFWFFRGFETSAQTVYLIYSILLLVILIFTAYRLWQANEKKEFAQVSSMLKIIMVLGICFMPLYYFVEF